MQPYDLGFDADESPDLSPLLREAFSSRTTVEGCAMVLLLNAKPESIGFRTFYSSASATAAPKLRIVYEPPTSAEQVGWTPDRSCPVSVAVPTTVSGSYTCDVPSDGAATKVIEDTNTCAHLHLEAVAASLS